MTISSEVSSSGPFYGNGATTIFPYAFKIVDETHIRAVLIAANGAVSDLSLSGGDFTITGVGDDAGGALVKASPLLEGEILTMVRNPPMTQETSLENQGAYYPEVIETRFDLAVMQIQAVREKVDRSLAVEPGQPLPDIASLLEAEGAAVAAAGAAATARDEAVAAKDAAVAAAESIDPEDLYTKPEIDTQQAAQDTAISTLTLELAETQADVTALEGRADTLQAADLALGGRITALETKEPYRSSEISIVTSSVTTLTHGLGRSPRGVMAYLLCKTAELGYAVGAKVLLGVRGQYLGSSNSTDGVQLSLPSATQIDVTIANTLPYIINRSGASPSYITAANWRLVVEAM